MRERPAKWRLIAAYAVLYIVWGSTYLAIRFTVETIPPLLSGSLRYLAAGTILLCARIGQTKNFPPFRGWMLALRASILPFVVNFGIITAAETVVPSSTVALIVALEPLWFCLMGWLLFNRGRPSARNYAGIALGFAGICVLMGFGAHSGALADTGSALWMLLILFATLCWVFGAFISADKAISDDTLISSGMQMLCGGAVMLALQCCFSAFTGDWPQLRAFSARSMLSLAYLVVFGSIIAYTSFLWLMRVEPASRVSTHAFVNPIIAVILGVLFGGEALSAKTLTSLAFVTASVVLMITGEKQRTS